MKRLILSALTLAMTVASLLSLANRKEQMPQAVTGAITGIRAGLSAGASGLEKAVAKRKISIMRGVASE